MTTEYNANEVTVTDQAGKLKKSYIDALGRLTSVVEDPAALNYTTSYIFDVLDNLTSVTQGSQTRTFVYTSLSRLTDATNPESGHTGYTYDRNGNILTKTDARNVVTTFDPYDGLNRPTQKSYSDGTPEITYLYDGPCLNCWGRLWMVYAVADDFYSDHDYHYDELGRVVLSGQYTWTPSGGGQQYWFRYRYKKSGAVETITYPTGKVVTNSHDGAGRLSGVSGYASGIEYAPQGAVNQMTLGNGVAESRTYNGRLQPWTITAVKDSNTLLSLTHGYGGTNNNGNVVSQTIAPLGVTQLYTTYDGLNRLKTFAEGGLSRSYDYDRYGNRWVPSNNGLPLAPQTPVAQSWFEAASNRIVAVEYDEAGNQEQVNPYRMEYDAENRQKSSTLTIGSEAYTSRYYYDPEHGRRVAKATPDGTTTVYVYDAFGKLAAEYSNPGPLEPATSYLTADHLGSTRLVTGSTGGIQERHDYLPFGEELFAGTGPRTQAMGYPISEPTGGVRQKFTGKERDAETGLDYFGARYFSGAQGRFTSPDWSERPEPVPYADLRDPQTLNLYVYGRNNPLSSRDLDGHCTVDGEEHGFWWCVAHAIGVTQTQKEAQAARARAEELKKQLEEDQERLRAEGKPTMLLGVMPIGPPASNVAVFEKLKDSLRAEMSAPSVVNAELRSLVEELYRPGATVGSGSTAAAVREELRTGQAVGGRFHSQKAQDYIKALENWLKRNPTATPGYRAAAENIIRDMRNALSGK